MSLMLLVDLFLVVVAQEAPICVEMLVYGVEYFNKKGIIFYLILVVLIIK